MASEKSLLDAIAKIEDDVNGVIATCGRGSGVRDDARRRSANRGDFDLTVASAYNSCSW